jgi:hypothetical protein
VEIPSPQGRSEWLGFAGAARIPAPADLRAPSDIGRAQPYEMDGVIGSSGMRGPPQRPGPGVGSLAGGGRAHQQRPWAISVVPYSSTGRDIASARGGERRGAAPNPYFGTTATAGVLWGILNLTTELGATKVSLQQHLQPHGGQRECSSPV